jgi:hypothetical protein
MKGPILPTFPSEINGLENETARWKRLQEQWNESMRILSQFHNIVHKGLVGQEYTVSGTVPVSAHVDMTSITVTAVAETLTRLLIDLKKSGILEVKEYP